MRIVILDGSAANPGDLSWTPIAQLGELVVHDFTQPEQTIPRLQGAQVALTNKTVLNEAVFAACPDLRYVGVLATGYNVVDLAAARVRGILVTNIPAYSTDSVAQFVFALLLELCSKVALHDQAVRDGEWARANQFCFWKAPLVELAGKTMGLVGTSAPLWPGLPWPLGCKSWPAPPTRRKRPPCPAWPLPAWMRCSLSPTWSAFTAPCLTPPAALSGRKPSQQ